ncbi:DUF222 domain-containing protein [Plantibacter sp. YIM 135347]|uniref:HNH endonuclease signature motif containing protein n=1 Tax=Plantibacter sp. YIM 135347 TaxID=3423919 RepID=UPI003D352F79
MTLTAPPAATGSAEPGALAAVDAALSRLHAVWDGARPAFGRSAAGAAAGAGAGAAITGSSGLAAVGLESMDDPGLLRVGEELGALQHALDAAQAAWAGTVAARSGKERGGDGLAKAHGYSSPVALLADRWRIAPARAAVLVDVGSAIVPKRTFLGEVQECEFPAIAEAIRPLVASPNDLSAAPPVALTVDAAAAMVRELRLGARVATTLKTAAVERLLVEHCVGVSPGDARKAAVRARMILDQDGAQPREQMLHARRSLRIVELPGGMTKLTAVLDPASAMWVRGAIDAVVSTALRTPHFVDTADPADSGSGACPGGSSASDTGESPDTGGCPATEQNPATPADMPEPRTLEQLRLDALVDTCRHVAGCTEAATQLAPVSIVIRMDLHDLTDGIGAAHIDGITEPITANTVRRIAGDANLIPAILTGPSQILDLGHARRLFSPGQKIALAERDGGCAWTGCPHPPAYTQAHHITWWSAGGTTDLSNGILLCSHHHHRVHADGWDIRIRDGSPWFIPPAHLDRTRTPRRGGNLHSNNTG